MRVQWEDVRLPTSTEPGYGEKALPVEEIVKRDGADGTPALPTLVWLYRQADKFQNGLIESTTFADEGIALSLRKFRCVRIDVESIADEEMKKAYGTTPGFRFLAPDAECIGSMEGDGAIAITRFSALVKKTWAKCYSMSQGKFVSTLTKVLDGYDRITAQRAQLSRSDDARAARLDAEETKLRELEQETLERCTLKKTYLPDE